jgi:uncharacterized protein with HEPN domain
MRDEGLYLADIAAAADAIDRFLAGMTEDDWIEDEVRQSAVMHRLIIIGEAAARTGRVRGRRGARGRSDRLRSPGKVSCTPDP